MNEILTKPILIGVSIFVTVAIASGVFAVFSQVSNVYKIVYETDVSIKSKFKEFDRYNGTVLNGVDLLNTVKAYGDNKKAFIKLKDRSGSIVKESLTKADITNIKNQMDQNAKDQNNYSVYKYENKFSVNVLGDAYGTPTTDGRVIITFQLK